MDGSPPQQQPEAAALLDDFLGLELPEPAAASAAVLGGGALDDHAQLLQQQQQQGCTPGSHLPDLPTASIATSSRGVLVHRQTPVGHQQHQQMPVDHKPQQNVPTERVQQQVPVCSLQQQETPAPAGQAAEPTPRSAPMSVQSGLAKSDRSIPRDSTEELQSKASAERHPVLPGGRRKAEEGDCSGADCLNVPEMHLDGPAPGPTRSQGQQQPEPPACEVRSSLHAEMQKPSGSNHTPPDLCWDCLFNEAEAEALSMASCTST